MYSLMANCFEWIRKRKLPNRAVTLVIIGLDDAGKTTMVASLQGEPPDGITPTIGFANAEFTINRCKVTVYDLGGGVRIRDVWKRYYAEVFGVVYVLDSCNVERLEETKEVFQQVVENSKILGKPFLIFANKQDKAGALHAEDISNALNLESSKYSFPFKVFQCSALKGYGRGVDKNINAGFQWLLNTISSEFGKIQARVEHDVTIQKEEEEREKKARIERIKKIREERDRLEREAGNDPDKEESDEEVIMANPFQPIGKHLDNLKSKEKRKKVEKDKKQKLNSTQGEMESKEEKGSTESATVKKKKKKKKKAAKSQEEILDVNGTNEVNVESVVDVEQQQFDGEIYSNDDDVGIVVKKKKKKKKMVRTQEEGTTVDYTQGDTIVDVEEHFVEDLHNLKDEITRMNAKKKKKKTKISQNLETNISGDDENLHISPMIKKHKKKKKQTFAEDVYLAKFGIEKDVECENDFKVDISALEKEAIENGQSLEAEDVVKIRKPKLKKRKKKKNRTVPLEEGVTQGETSTITLPAPVWKTPPAIKSSLPPIGSNGDASNFRGLPPLSQHKTKNMMAESTVHHLPSSPSWARTRPNSEDYDLVT